jgi:hypothetical protein
MWVSRSDWDDLNRRLERVEGAAFLGIKRPTKVGAFGCFPHYDRLSVSEAVKMIAAHFGLKFSYRAESFVMETEKRKRK